MSHVYIHIVSRFIYSVFSAWYGKAIDIPCIRCSVKCFCNFLLSGILTFSLLILFSSYNNLFDVAHIL